MGSLIGSGNTIEILALERCKSLVVDDRRAPQSYDQWWYLTVIPFTLFMHDCCLNHEIDLQMYIIPLWQTGEYGACLESVIRRENVMAKLSSFL